MNDLCLVATYSGHFNDGEVAIAIVIGAIRRIFTRDPVIRMRRRTILEHYEVVIPLATCGVNTFLVIEVEQRIRVTPMQWQGGISALDGSDIWIRSVGASGFAHVAVVVTEILGWREGDAGTGRGRDLVLGDPSPAKQLVPGPDNAAG